MQNQFLYPPGSEQEVDSTLKIGDSQEGSTEELFPKAEGKQRTERLFSALELKGRDLEGEEAADSVSCCRITM